MSKDEVDRRAKSPQDAVFDHNTFYPAFLEDLQNAEKLVLIQSPFVGARRVTYLRAALKSCIKRGVRICVFIQQPADCESVPVERQASIETALSILEKLEVHINLLPKIHEKLAIIDETIGWEGSLNILSHVNTSERMVRVTEPIRVIETAERHGLKSCHPCRSKIGADFSSNLPEDVLFRKLIGTKLAERRQAYGLTQLQLAQELRIEQNVISEIEAGKRDIRLSKLSVICKRLDLKLIPEPWYSI